MENSVNFRLMPFLSRVCGALLLGLIFGLFPDKTLFAESYQDPTARVISLANASVALPPSPDLYGNPATIGGVNKLNFSTGYNILFPGLSDVMAYHLSAVAPIITLNKAIVSTVGVSFYNRFITGLNEQLLISAAWAFNFGKLKAIRGIGFTDLIYGARIKVYQSKFLYNGELGAGDPTISRLQNIFNVDMGLQARIGKQLRLGFAINNFLPFGYGQGLGSNTVSAPGQIEGGDLHMALGGSLLIPLGKFIEILPIAEASYLAEGFGGRIAFEINFLDLIFLRLGSALGMNEPFNMGLGMGMRLQTEKFLGGVDMAFKWLPTAEYLGTGIQTLGINLNIAL